MLEITDDTFERDLPAAGLPVMLVFTGTFCGPSAWFDPMTDKAAEDFADEVLVAKVDIEACPRLTRHLQIKGTPTVMIVNRGEPVASRIGTMTYSEFRAFIRDSIGKIA